MSADEAVTACGTYGGYQRHYRAGEYACDPCKRALADYQAQYRKRRPDLYRVHLAREAARGRAMRKLAELHRAEFLRLYDAERTASA